MFVITHILSSTFDFNLNLISTKLPYSILFIQSIYMEDRFQTEQTRPSKQHEKDCLLVIYEKAYIWSIPR